MDIMSDFSHIEEASNYIQIKKNLEQYSEYVREALNKIETARPAAGENSQDMIVVSREAMMHVLTKCYEGVLIADMLNEAIYSHNDELNNKF